MKKNFYITPEVEILEVAVEGGFNLSADSDSMDYIFDGDGLLMD